MAKMGTNNPIGAPAAGNHPNNPIGAPMMMSNQQGSVAGSNPNNPIGAPNNASSSQQNPMMMNANPNKKRKMSTYRVHSIDKNFASRLNCFHE